MSCSHTADTSHLPLQISAVWDSFPLMPRKSSLLSNPSRSFASIPALHASPKVPDQLQFPTLLYPLLVLKCAYTYTHNISDPYALPSHKSVHTNPIFFYSYMMLLSVTSSVPLGYSFCSAYDKIAGPFAVILQIPLGVIRSSGITGSARNESVTNGSI